MTTRSWLPALVFAGGVGVLALCAPTGHAATAAPRVPTLDAKQAVPSSNFWAAHRAAEVEAPAPSAIGNVVYQGDTDATFQDLVAKASALPQTSGTWTNAGPYNGVVDVPGQGSGSELLGAVEGIGTAMQVDPSDKTGNTVYLGTFGGLYKSTDGGKTEKNISDGSFARDQIGAIAVDPRDPQTVYAGTGVSVFTLSDDAVGAGVYVSHDAGNTWTRPVLNTKGYGTNAIAVDPKDGSVLVATTFGLWRSTDHGASFQQVQIPDNAAHTAQTPDPLGSWTTTIAYNPGTTGEVTVAVGYAFGKKSYAGDVIAPGNGLYRSTDGGATFSHLASDSQLTTPTASTDPLGRSSLSYSTAPGGTGVLWDLVQDPGRATGQTLEGTPALPAGVSATGGSVLNGLFRSSDDGATWTLQADAQTLTTALGSTNAAATYPLSYAEGVQSQYNNWVLADPLDPNRVFLGLEEVFTGEFNDPTDALPAPSTTFTAIEKYANACGFLTYYNTIPNNNGVSCPQQVPEYGSGTTHPDQHSATIAVTPTGGEKLYSGNDGGWWEQDSHTVMDTTGATGYAGFDNASWSALAQNPTVLPWDVTFLQDGTQLLALQDNGVAHVKKDGSAVQVCGGDGVYVFPGKDASSYYCGIDGQTILGTTDDFQTTVNVTPTSVATGATFLSPWATDLTDPDHLIAAAGNIDETTAGLASNTYDPTQEEMLSSTWVNVFTPPAPTTGVWDSSAVTTTGAVSYAAMCDLCRPSLGTGSAADPTQIVTKVVTNVKAGCTPAKATATCWHMAASNGLPHQQISDIAVDPNDAETIYVGLRSLIVLGSDPAVVGTQKVMVSHDGGETFTDLTGNLPSADVYRVVLRDGQLYVAGDVGIFTAKAGSASWSRFDTGLPEVTYRSLRLSADGSQLLAGAYGRGDWIYSFGAASVTPPTVVPTLPNAPTAPRASGTLAATGLDAGLPVAAALLLGGGLVLRRRRTSTAVAGDSAPMSNL